ncbi:MAG: CcmD family protein [Desulfovibrionaceae bacterium]
MNGQVWLAISSIAIWFGMGLYLLFLGVKQKEIENKIAEMEKNYE